MTAYPSDQRLIGVRIHRQDHGDVVVLTVHGELDVASAAELREALRHAIAERAHQRVVVDLEAVDFIDSVGLGVLLGALKRVRDHAGDLVLLATGHHVLKVLELTGLTRTFGIEASLESALDALPVISAPPHPPTQARSVALQ